MKRDTTHDVSDGLALLKKRAPMDEVALTTKAGQLIAAAPAPREIDNLFLAKMERLGWTWDGSAWVHELDGGGTRGRPPAAKQAAPAKPAKDRGSAK